MIRINLLPVREISAEVGRRQELMIAGIALALTVALIAGLYLSQAHKKSKLVSDVAGLKKEIETLEVQLKEIGNLQKDVKALEEKLKIIDSLSKKKAGPVRVMESLSASLPARLWLTEFREAGGNVSISGLAIDNQTVADFLRALSSHPYFNNVDLVETTQVDQEGIPLKRFSIRSQLLYQPPPPKGTAADSPAKEGKKS